MLDFDAAVAFWIFYFLLINVFFLQIEDKTNILLLVAGTRKETQTILSEVRRMLRYNLLYNVDYYRVSSIFGMIEILD